MKQKKCSSRQKSSVATSLTLSAPASTENKSEWIRLGNQYENEFCKLMNKRHYRCEINPAKVADPYGPDLLVNGRIAELKTRRTPFFMAGKLGVPPESAITINRKDIDRYLPVNPGMNVYFWVYWAAQERYGIEVPEVCGVWVTRVDKLARLCDKAPVHAYQNRCGEDGNKKESYVINLKDMRQVI